MNDFDLFPNTDNMIRALDELVADTTSSNEFNKRVFLTTLSSLSREDISFEQVILGCALIEKFDFETIKLLIPSQSESNAQKILSRLKDFSFVQNDADGFLSFHDSFKNEAILELQGLKDSQTYSNVMDVVTNIVRQRWQDAFDDNRYSTAIQSASWLMSQHPNNSEYLYNLGLTYLYAGNPTEAIHWLTIGVENAPNDYQLYALRGRAFSVLEQFDLALLDHNNSISLTPTNPFVFFARATTLHAMDRYEEALVDLSRAIELDPSLVSNYGFKASIQASLRRFEDALTTLDAGLLKTNSIKLRKLRASVYLSNGMIQEAISEFGWLIDNSAPDPSLYMFRARAKSLTDEPYSIIKDYDAAINLDPENIENRVEKVYYLQSIERFDEALQELNDLILLDSHNARLFDKRAITHARMGNYLKAIGDHNKSILLENNNSAFYCDRAVTHALFNNHEKAIRDFAKAIKLDSHYAPYYANRAASYESLENYTAAISDLNKAIDLDNSDIHYRFRLAVLYHLNNENEIAERVVKVVIDLAPDVADHFALMGDILEDNSDHANAKANYDRAIALDANESIYFHNRGVSKLGLGEYHEAITDFSTAIKLEPEVYEYFGNRAKAYIALGKYEDALDDFSKALSLEDSDRQLYIERGNLFEEMGDYDAAIEDYQKVIKYPDNNTSIYNTLGLLHAYKGQYKTAISYYKMALKSDQSNLYAKYNMIVASYLQDGTENTTKLLEDGKTTFSKLAGSDSSGESIYALAGLLALSEDPQAFDILERAVQLEPNAKRWATREPAWIKLRNHPKFIAIVNKANPTGLDEGASS